MKEDIALGTRVDSGPADGIAYIKLPILLRSGLLVQSNTGGGKSWALRRIAEQVCPLVPTIIIDPEGEFSSLRARFPFVLIGPGGDAPASVVGARLTALRLLELRICAVVDLFTLKPSDRQLFVAEFFDAITEAPKDLWHDTVIMLDEAHKYAPEKGDSPAGDPIATAASVWRKRGKCLIAATQRLAKFNKDAAAELQNKLIGPTFMDIDRERAAEELGIARGTRAAFYQQIKTLAPGTFFGIGRAISDEPTIIRSGPVISIHPEAGSKRHLDPPPAPDQIRHLLPQLVDLPKEAETKLKTEKDLRAEVANLKRRLAEGDVSPPHPTILKQLNEDRAKYKDRCESYERALHQSGITITQLAGLDGITGAEVRRLRAMERHFDPVIDAIDAYRAEGGGSWARPMPVSPDIKAKAETLNAETFFDLPRAPSAAKATSTQPPEGWTDMEEELYQKFKARLLQEVPGLLKVLTTAPEIEVTIKREVIEVDGKSLRGRVARLIADGFLDSGKTNGEVGKEIDRTGPQAHPSNVLKEMKNLIEMGFVHRTDGGRFIVAPGAKVNIKR